MAKKKKKNKGRKASATAPKQQDAAVLMQDQKEALMALRGRRSSVLGERIYQDEAVDESVRRRAYAAGQEAYLRELLAKGHLEQVRAKAGKLLKNDGWLAGFWALSLQLRLGLVDDLEGCLTDRDWLARLRAELVDPADLCGIEGGGLGDEARRVLEAWTLVGQGEHAAALERLQGIGRRSPLVDWRLFVQVLASAGKNDWEGAALAVDRMLGGCPARSAAGKLMACGGKSEGFYARRLKRLEQKIVRGRLKTTDYPALESVVKHALAQKRPGLALTLAAAFAPYIENQHEANRYFALFERMRTDGFSLDHIYLRIAVVDQPHDGLLAPDVMKDLRKNGWSKSESIRLWIGFFGQAREKWNILRQDAMEWELEDMRDTLLFPLLADCHWLARDFPDCWEIYLFWDWAEKECGTNTQEGMDAYATAFPDDPVVLELAVARFAEAGVFKKAELGLTRLGRLLKSESKIAELQQLVLFHRIKAAYFEEDAEAIETLAGRYSGENLFERIQIAFMRWMVASKGNKRQRGAELAEFNSPWLVLYCGCSLEWGFKKTKLPAAAKRSLENEPDAVLQGFLDLLELDAKSALIMMKNEEPSVALGKALDHPGCSVVLLKPVLSALLMRMRNLSGYIYEMDGLMGAFRTLLNGDADAQAMAVALRVRLAFVLVKSRLDAEKAERSLRVAWTLAGREETRTLILRLNSMAKVLKGKLLKKTATEKMIKAELKMQGKFQNLHQVEKRYVSQARAWDALPEGFNPFDGMDLDEIENLLEPDFGDSKCDGNCSKCDLCPSDEGMSDPGAFPEPEPVKPPKSRPYAFSKFVPSTEMEFERLIEDIQFRTRGKHRKKAAETLETMIENAVLSDKAKVRVQKKQHELLEGD